MLEIRWDSKSKSSARSRKKMAAKLGENLAQDGASADIGDWFINVRQSFTVTPYHCRVSRPEHCSTVVHVRRRFW